MKKQYDEMFKKQCVELVVKKGRTISSIQREFNLGNGTLNTWIKKYSSLIGLFSFACFRTGNMYLACFFLTKLSSYEK
ncbi:transposase [Bacillus cereus]|uniref:transposase n=1 Tax=Bacillus cereus TaxID=1396 RepID=UPI0020D211D9|nr:transposase [Bacillus cereus]